MIQVILKTQITMNKKGEFVLHELHKVCPKYIISEFIKIDDGTIVYEDDTVKYLGIHLIIK